MIFNLKYILFFLISSIFGVENLVYEVSISGTIDMGLPHYIERVVKQAETDNASVIIFEIDTFGGRVDAATQIKDIILDSKVQTVAFINKRAISAGALISLSCDSIYMTSGASIGAATAVSLDGKKASEKVISYMREEMATTAEANNKSRQIASGMVDEELYIESFISINGDTLTISDVEGFKEGKLITLSTNLALKLGIADGEFNSKEELLRALGLVDYKKVEFNESWSEKLVRFLTNPVVAPLFMSLGMLGLFMEIRTPGLGFPGLIGLLCLSLFFGSHFLVGLADITELIFLILGLLLIVLEIAVVPGFGIVGIPGFLMIVYSLFTMLIGEYPLPEDFNMAIRSMSYSFVLMLILGTLIFRALTRSDYYKKLIPVEGQPSSKGFSISKGYQNLIGEIGKCVTVLRPSGRVEINGKVYQAMSTGEYIEKGESVKVSHTDENQIVVKKV